MTVPAPPQSRRMAGVQSAIISVVGRWTAETPGTLALGQGVVWYGPPAEAIAAVKAFPARPADNLYGAVQGESALIAAIEEKLRRENGIDAGQGCRVVATAGGNQAFMNAILAVTDPGDEVILQVPYYFNHEMAVGIAGARAVLVPADASNQLDLEAIERAITPRTRAVVTVSPNNPTGAVYPESALRAVNDLCRSRGVFHIHDEVYEYFTYGDTPHFSPGSITGAAAHTISLYSLSKAYGMAGWRLGYMVIPDTLWETIDKIQDTLLVCPPMVSQHVALAALRVGRAHSSSHLDRLVRMRTLIAEGLTQPGVPCDLMPAEGALYYFVRVHTTLDDLAVAERLIRQHRVAVIPGSAFGASGGCYIRVSYGAVEEATVEESISRLVTGLRALA